MPAATPSGSVDAAVLDDGEGAALGERCAACLLPSAALPSWSMSSLSQTMLVPPLAPASAMSSAPAAASRSGAKGCGVSAAAVERASAGASMRAVESSCAVLAVGDDDDGPAFALGLGDDAIDHAHALVPAGGGSPAVVDDDGDRTGAVERGFARRIQHRLGQRKMTARRPAGACSVSHQGEAAGVFSWFSSPTRMRVGGNVTWCGLRRNGAQQPIDDGQRCQRREQPGVEER